MRELRNSLFFLIGMVIMGAVMFAFAKPAHAVVDCYKLVYENFSSQDGGANWGIDSVDYNPDTGFPIYGTSIQSGGPTIYYSGFKVWRNEGGTWLSHTSRTSQWNWNTNINGELVAEANAVPSGECPVPEPCPEAGTPTGYMQFDGLYITPDTACVDGCSVQYVSSGGLTIAVEEAEGWITGTEDYEYTGEDCSESDPPPTGSLPVDCIAQKDLCNEFCKNDTDINTCDETTGNSECKCTDMPPFPLIKPSGGSFEPDQDKDGEGSSTDPDVDGDGKNNGSDEDVDGDGKGNGSDGDVDGDGISNDGNSDKWEHEQGEGDGTGADPDIDGDGIGNCDDDDMDGDGVYNWSDSDTDGDGIYNYLDPEIDAGCTGAAGDGTVTSDEDITGDDGTGTGTDTDGDGEQDAWDNGERSVDFGPLVEAGKTVSKQFPISIASDLSKLADSFRGTPSAPTFTGNVHGVEYQIDLSFWDPVATVCRSLMALVIVAGGIVTIIQTWSN